MPGVHAGGADVTPTGPRRTAQAEGDRNSALLLGEALYDFWAEGDFAARYPGGPAHMLDAMIDYWLESRGRMPVLKAEISTLTAKNSHLGKEARRRQKLADDRRLLARLVILERKAGRSFRPGEIGQVWRALREGRFVGDGRGGWVVPDTGLRILGPPSDLDRTPATHPDEEDRILVEALRAYVLRQTSEIIDPKAAVERRWAAFEAMWETKMKPVKDGISQLRAELEAHRRKFKESGEALLRERSPVGKDRPVPATPGDGSLPGPSATARGGQASLVPVGRARLATASAAPSAPNAQLVTSKAVLARQRPGGRNRKDASPRRDSSPT